MANTVRQMIAALSKMDPDAIVLWSGGCSAAAIAPKIKAVVVSPINDSHYTLLGPDRKIKGVLIGVEGD